VNFDKIIELAIQESPEAQYLLGINKFLNEPESYEGIDWLTKAAKAGHKIANYTLGCIYYQGKSDNQYKKAIYYLERASSCDYPKADYLLGIAHHFGHGCPINLLKSKEFLETALQSGILEQSEIIISTLLIKNILTESVETKLENIIIKNINNNSNVKSLRKTFNVDKIQRNNQLILKIKAIYRNKCQICGVQLDIGNGQSYSEVHHIRPLGSPHNGPDVSENMIVVCPDHHAMFDRGAISIDLARKSALHKNIMNPIHGKKILILHHIEESYITYHNNFIFANF
jgi:hypothetical protein